MASFVEGSKYRDHSVGLEGAGKVRIMGGIIEHKT